MEFMKDLEEFEDILHMLNIKGEKQGVQFKRGNTQYYQGDLKLPKYKSIICSCKMRNKKSKKN